MRKKRFLQYAVAVGALTALVALYGCGSEPAKPAADNGSQTTSSEKKADDKAADSKKDAKSDAAQLSDWAGTWNDFGLYLDDPELASSYQTVADRDGTTADEVKSKLEKRRECDFHGMVIDSNKISFLDAFKDKNGKETSSSEYTFKESHKVQHGNSELEWDVFEAKNADAKYKILMMMPIHGEEVMTHFHLRYGDNVDELLKKDDWFPTFVKPSTTLDQIKSEITE